MRASSILVFAAVAFVGVSVSACSSLNTGMSSALEPATVCTTPAKDGEFLVPADAVRAIVRTPDHCQPGVFALTVHSTGRNGSVLYLNSEADYHNPHNLSIAVLPKAQETLAHRLGHDFQRQLLGKTLVVEGTARLVRHDISVAGVVVPQVGDGAGGGAVSPTFYPAPRPSIDVYFEAHVVVNSADKLWLVQKDGEAQIPGRSVQSQVAATKISLADTARWLRGPMDR